MESSETGKLTQKAALTRQRIIDTALHLFATKVYDQTTMRDIAAAADCSLGLAYRYFASKDAPRASQVDELATLLYGLQLALVLFWLQDLSNETHQTE